MHSRHGGKAEQWGLSPSQTFHSEVVLDILDALRPHGCITPPESTADYPLVDPKHLESRTGLLNVCLASRALYDLAIPYLYRDALIKDRRELYRFFCTLAKRRDRRPMVRNFAWAGVIWEAHIDAAARRRHRQDNAAMLTECWDSIKDEWPLCRQDLKIARFSESNAPGALMRMHMLLYFCGIFPGGSVQDIADSLLRSGYQGTRYYERLKASRLRPGNVPADPKPFHVEWGHNPSVDWHSPLP